MAKQVLLIGCGRMGAALLKGWLASGAVENPIVVEPMPSSLPAGVKAVPLLTDVAGLLPDTILLAVKPQMLDEVLPALKTRLPKGALVISIAAGKTLSYFADRFGPNVKIVRTMPNTPAAIGRGITVCCAGAGVTAAQRAEADGLMRAVGEVEWVEDESFMHAVTALSGSGPAYVFLLIQALSEAGIAAGLPADLSARLAKATVAGSGALAASSSDEPAKLRADVTSPGGTTAAALAVLMGEDGLSDIMTRAVAAATARSKELAKG